MLLGFKRQFAPLVESGAKRHTIRGTSGREWKPGTRCDCYVDPRQKTMRLLGRWPCIRVEQITIDGGWEALSGEFFGDVKINGNSLLSDEREQLAHKDGFASFADMAEFWRGRLPFEGIIIHWDFDKPCPVEAETNGQRWKR